ncbi:MFS transporter [Streptomyces sp. AK02-01A]|uniref:MFS transporter n=1 Tax=Streptomyces sp. AK02-01A TaxID=3028648 RepID=UPI0029B585B7|nr:MFS transporter [Streptomyces sp. AK02-01A]MDX3852826.1 MFS transporter [Streptomyces sp. AK02-01A]
MSETALPVSALASAPVAPAPQRPAHRDGNVLRWLSAYTASMVGDSVYYLALSWAATRTGSPTQAGLVLAVGAVPRAVLMLGGGVLADRFGPRRVVIGSDAARCLFILGMAAALLFTTPTLWLLATVALVFGAVDALFLPAVGALPPRITTPGQLARVQGLRGLAARVANVTGAPLGGLAVALGGSVTAFAVAGALFAVSLPLLLALRIAPEPAREAAGQAGTAWSELVDGLRYIRRHRVLAPLLLVVAVGELGFVGPLNIGLTLLVQERGWGADGMGWIVAAFGAGAGASSLALAVKGRVPRAGLVQAIVLSAGSAAVAALAFAPSIGAAVVVGVLIGLLAGLSGALNGALLQTASDPAYLGRVTSVATLFMLGIAPLCYPLTGAAVSLWGTGPVFVVSAAVCGTGGLLGFAFPAVRRAELPD